MTIEAIPGGGFVASGRESVDLVRMAALKGAMRLEMHGLKRRGGSVFSVVKKEFNLKGSKEAVFEAFLKIMAEKEKAFFEKRASPEV